MAKIKLKINGKDYEHEKGASLFSLIEKNMPGAKYSFAAAKESGKNDIIELMTPVEKELELEWITASSPEGLNILRHSTSHVMAAAVLKLFPGTKIAIGPATDEGFYYDFDTEIKFNEESFILIEKEMQKIIDNNEPFIKSSISKTDALKKFGAAGEIYKTELIGELKDGEITLYETAGFTDLCRGPHVPSSGYIRAFKLLRVAGAYWRGSEKNKMLQRIYGTAFSDKKELKAYITRIQEALERDHRKIGKEMSLFGFYAEGPGFPFWKPNGMILYNTVLDYWRKIHTDNGYVEVKTPIILNESLWHQSGHWDHYKENMYFTTIDEATYAVKPMNCPGGLLIFRDGIHSYKELPMKVAELGLVHRHEKSGVLHGLFRVRQFTQDDAHVFCTKEMVKDEVIKVINLIKKIYSDFGFNDVAIELSTRPEHSIGSDEIWEISEKSLAAALTELGIEYKLNPGDGAFYGPKIDFHIKDAIGRSWQCGTIQCDFSMPERFDITYVAADGKKQRPVMLHRAILGSIERFIGILIEHYKGKFPFWLAPEQIKVLPIAEIHNEYAENVKNILKNFGFRVNIDNSSDPLGARIKNARLSRTAYIIVIGDNEIKEKSVTVRKSDKDDNQKISLDNLTGYFSGIKNSLL